MIKLKQILHWIFKPNCPKSSVSVNVGGYVKIFF